MMQNVVAYVTPLPLPRNNAVTEQRSRIARWASRRRVHIAAWREEQAVGEGSVFYARPAMMVALSDLLQGGALAIASRDFLDVFDEAIVERLAQRAGARVVAVDGTKASREVVRLVTLLESYEHALASTRARAARRQREAVGAPFGQVAWGFRRSADETRVVRDAREQRVLAIAAHMRANGFTLREITEELARHDLRSRRGRPIGVTRVYEMLRDIETQPRYELLRKVLRPGPEQTTR
jgi:hypothetical protein